MDGDRGKIVGRFFFSFSHTTIRNFSFPRIFSQEIFFKLKRLMQLLLFVNLFFSFLFFSFILFFHSFSLFVLVGWPVGWSDLIH